MTRILEKNSRRNRRPMSARASLLVMAMLSPMAIPHTAVAGVDEIRPVVTFTTKESPTASIVVFFDEPAGPVTADNLVVEHGDGSLVDVRRRCYDGSSASTSCTGLVRKAILSPRTALPLGDRITAIANPSGIANRIKDAAGNSAIETTAVQPIRPTQSETGPSLSTSWRQVSSSGASAGTFVSASSAGMVAKFTFVGDRVVWRTRTSPRDGLVEVRVGADFNRRIDLSKDSATFGVRKSFAGFGDGKHELRIIALGEVGRRGTGTAVVVDGFSDSRGWFGEHRADYLWQLRSWPSAKGRIAWTETTLASIDVLFFGTGLDWWHPTGPNLGIVGIKIDGQEKRQIDQYSSSTGTRRRTISGLRSGVHTLSIRALGKRSLASSGNAVGLDRVDVSAPVDMFKGLGAWVDLFDYSGSTSATDISRSLDTMRGYGVKTLYLQTARYNSGKPFLYRSRVDIWLREAHERGIQVVGWYFPAYSQYLKVDISRSIAVANYRSPTGERFDALGVDIEYRGETSGPPEFNEDIVTQLEKVRAAVGITYPVSSIAPPPNQMELAPSSWAGFPWKAIGRLSNAILPMAYSSYRKGSQCPDQPRYCTKGYTKNAVLTVREETGKPSIPVHVIGGIADLLTRGEMKDFVAGAEAAKAYGASMYDHSTMMRDPRKYELLQAFTASRLP